MGLPENLAPLLAPISSLQRLLERLGGRGVILGGVATGFHGKPRFTVDVDAMVLASVNDIPQLLLFAKEEGIEPRIENVDGFARKNRVLKDLEDVRTIAEKHQTLDVERIKQWAVRLLKYSNSRNYGNRLNPC